MEKRIDLHLHTTASDGSASPAEAVALACSLGLAAIAVTDHDTAAGAAEAVKAGQRAGLEVIPGIEISTDYRGRDSHILGLFIDPASEGLRPALDWAVNERTERNRRIVAALAADGFDISMEALEQANPGSVIGRPHIAKHLMKKDYVPSVKAAFEKYLGEGRPYYRPRTLIPLADAVRCIRAAGGIAIVAHPFQYGYDEPELLAYIDACRSAGCTGVEAYYSEHSPEQRDYLLALAREEGMAVSGGSDWHGTFKPHIRMGSGIDGSLSVPLSVLDELKKTRP